MSTILFESVTRTSSSSSSSSQSHSITVVGGNHKYNSNRNFNQQSSIPPCPSFLKRSSYPNSMHSSSSLQTPPPTPRRSEGPVGTSSSPSPFGETRQYPRHLTFPIPKKLVSSNDRGQGICMSMEDKLVHFSSDFAGVPVDYVRLLIRKRGEKSSTFRLDGTEDIQIPPRASDLEPNMAHPSHVLAVYPLSSSPTSTPELHGIHSIVFTIYCANFPPFPKSDNNSSTPLPRLPIRLPHPPSFKIILHFLYTRNIQNILSYLLPVSWSSRRQQNHISHPTTLPLPISLSALSGWVRDLFNSLSTDDRYHHINLLHGVYLNVVALGMYDLPLQGSKDDDSDSVGNGKKNVDSHSHGIAQPSPEYGSIVLQNGTRDVDGRLLCLCLIAMWEALWKN